MTTKTKKSKGSKKSPCEKIKHSSLLLPREIFKTERRQLVVSLLMLVVLVIQIYLFISIYRLMDDIADLL